MEKKYIHEQYEQEMQQLWAEHDIFSANLQSLTPEEKREKLFSIDTPPPTVSGSLHIGHVFSYTHTDFIARYKRLRNLPVYYPMGFDDNGLPTERYVEKKHKTKASILGRSKFIKLCQEEVIEAHDRFSGLWKKMGLSIDWQSKYSTISDTSRKLAQRAFLDLLDKNLVTRQKTPALYCPTCQTSVAQAELDNTDQNTLFNTIIFQDRSGNNYEIATTRPELLPACVAVFYHPDDSRYANLKDQELLTPVYNKPVPCLPDDKVEQDKGTGLVMCCTFGDQTDIYWYQTHKLPAIQIISNNGIWNDKTGPLEGLRVHDARKKIIELLEQENKLVEQKKISHAVSVHERCKQSIEYIIIPQWYVNILENKEQFLKNGAQINWYPGFMQSRYRDWVENLGWDWCISRQRYYGVPFPVWHCANCSAVIPAPENSLPIDPQESIYPGKNCPSCNSENITPETDVMDTWNISSLTPFMHTGLTEQEHLDNQENTVPLPMSMRPQAHDIIRTWAFYTIIKAQYHQEKLPWKDIVISGHVTSGSGKISKSTGGADTTPDGLLKNYSADAIRYWSGKGGLGVDTAFSEKQIVMGNRLVTKLWNAFLFVSSHITGNSQSSLNTKLDPINLWLVSKLSETTKNYINYFEKFEYSHALEQIDQFFWHDFCDNYLELIKDQLFNPEKYSAENLENTRAVLYTVGLEILKLYGPFVPHVTEKIYQELYYTREQVRSLHKTEIKEKIITDLSAEEKDQNKKLLEILLESISRVRKIKSSAQCSLKTPIKNLELYIGEKNQNYLEQFKTLETVFAGITKTEKIIFSDIKIHTSSFEKLEDSSEQNELTLNVKISLESDD